MKKISYLKYYQLILRKVSFDKVLLTKEYRKAMRHLTPPEAEKLRQWMQNNHFYDKITPPEQLSA